MMTMKFDDVTKFGQPFQAGLETSMKLWGEWSKGMQAIGAEMSDYTKRSFEDGTQTFEKLLTAKSFEQAFEIQSSYVKRSYDEYMHQLSKIGNMYAEITKEAYRPLERAISPRR
jgi:hypothetical protein